MFYVKKKKERKEERYIKYNEKDTFTPIFKQPVDDLLLDFFFFWGGGGIGVWVCYNTC